MEKVNFSVLVRGGLRGFAWRGASWPRGGPGGHRIGMALGTFLSYR